MGIVAGVVYFAAFNIKPVSRCATGRLTVMSGGTELLIAFAAATTVSAVWTAGLLVFDVIKISAVLWNALIVFLALLIVFWNGIIRVYLTSVQLGLKWRIIGAACGWIPIVHLFTLGKIIFLTAGELKAEEERFALDRSRESRQICKTKYPIVMVHGVFFRDFRFLNYWGRIPEALSKNGADIYYGEQQSAASVEECGSELAERIKQILKKTGSEKVNIIAHSKGGLDSRWAISNCGMAKQVASLTTVNTPHKGCIFARELIHKAPQSLRDFVSSKYNGALLKLGDPKPDFMAAVTDLTDERCAGINESCPDMPGVYYQSVGSFMRKHTGGKFPLNVSYHLVKLYDGVKNDGLVELDSMKWGERFILLEPKGRRGISHGDVIDLNRENIKDFDVREFYVSLVSELREKGF